MKGILRRPNHCLAPYQTVTTSHGSTVWCYKRLSDNVSGSKFRMYEDFKGYGSSLKTLVIPEVFL